MNPELRRNLWVELTTHRLLAMPAVLLLVFGVLASQAGREWPSTVSSAATGIFIVLVIFWGSRQASASVSDEVRNRTWDWQRLSSLTPWQMAWGKLWGATAFTWYGGLLCIATLLVASSGMPTPRTTGWLVLGLVSTGLTLQGAALAASLQAARKDSRLGQRVGTLILLPVAVAALFVFMSIVRGPFNNVTWFARQWEPVPFMAVSAAVFAAWSLLAAHREMSRELRVARLPWAYIAFIAFLATYVSGFGDFHSGGMRSAFIFAGLIVAVVLAYYALFAEHTTAIRLRRMSVHGRAGRWRRFAEDLPLWAPALLAVWLFAIAAVAFPHRFESSLPAKWIGGYPVAAALLATRDVGILVFFALAPRARRVEAATLLYIILLSYVVPMFLGGIGMDAVAKAFLPFGVGSWEAAGVMAAHVAIVGAAVAWRWRRYN
jgi:drug/metabolite transporter superfamily protein YnfA